MNAKDDAGTAFTGDVAEIARLLTTIARRAHPTAGGGQSRRDFGEVISLAIAAAAANLGGTDALLAGRPDSWEADCVRRIIEGTVPDGELHRFRTEPVRLLLDPESVFEDAGLKGLFDEQDSTHCEGYSIGTEPDDQGQNDAEVDARRLALEAAYHAALDSYFDSFVDTARQAAAAMDLAAPVEVKRVADYPIGSHGDPLAEKLHAAALEHTPLPVEIHPKPHPAGV